jgi:hypothetical protein
MTFPRVTCHDFKVPNRLMSVRLSLDLVDRLEREVLAAFKAVNRRAAEIGGVLLGRVTEGEGLTVAIESWEPIACDYERGPLYQMSSAEKERLGETVRRLRESSQAVVGFFRSNARKRLVVDEDDLTLFREFFSDTGSVFLLVRPHLMKPSVGGLFFWDRGSIQPEPCLQFPLRRSELVGTAAAQTGGVSGAIEPASVIRSVLSYVRRVLGFSRNR